MKKQKQEEQEKEGKPWKKMKVFNSFEDADKKRNQLIVDLGLNKQYSEGRDFQIKVKRCGIGGTRFKVKLRYLS